MLSEATRIDEVRLHFSVFEEVSHLGLTPGTVSAALNNSAAARSIPEHTKNRIIEAAKTLNYRPNFFARTLANPMGSSETKRPNVGL
ncbi:MAG: hypothetical protein DMG55_26240 [Acidobacteria bacterium]|nr:MAG: hypothetical protein DMG55_26240 [Acidobacteriota bacterium]